MTLEDTRTHEDLARMDRDAENAAERMGRQTDREDVMSDRDRADRYKTLLEDAQAEIAQLSSWKESATTVLLAWKAVFDDMEAPGVVGEAVSDVAMAWVRNMRAKNAEQAKEIERLKDQVDEYRNYCLFTAVRWPEAVQEYRIEYCVPPTVHPSQAQMVDWMVAKNAALKARVETLEGLLKALVEKDVHTVECDYAVIGGVPCNCKVPAMISGALNPQQETPHV